MKDSVGNISNELSSGSLLTFDTQRPSVDNVSFSLSGTTTSTGGIGDTVLASIEYSDNQDLQFPDTVTINGHTANLVGPQTGSTSDTAQYSYIVASGDADTVTATASDVTVSDRAGNETDSSGTWTGVQAIDANAPWVQVHEFNETNDLINNNETGHIAAVYSGSSSFGNKDTLSYTWTYSGSTSSSEVVNSQDLEVNLMPYIQNRVESFAYTLQMTATDGVNTDDATSKNKSFHVNFYPSYNDSQSFSSLTQDASFSKALAISDSDSGDTVNLSFSSATLPGISVSGHTISYTPNNSDVGSHSGTFTLVDSKSGQTTQNVSFDVANINDAPVFNQTASSASVVKGQDLNFSLLVNDIDLQTPNSDTLSYSLDMDDRTGAYLSFGSNTGKTLTGSTASGGFITWIPNDNDVTGTDTFYSDPDPHTFTVTASDASGATAQKSIDVYVLEENTAPSVDDLTLSKELTNNTLAATVQASDPQEPYGDEVENIRIDVSYDNGQSYQTGSAYSGSYTQTGINITPDVASGSTNTGVMLRVQVFDKSNSGSTLYTGSSFTVDKTAPQNGSLSLSGSSNATYVTLTSQTGSDNISYSGAEIWYAVSGSVLTKWGNVNTGSAYINNLQSNTNYDFQIRDYDSVGNVSQTGITVTTNAYPKVSNIELFGSSATATSELITSRDDVYLEYNYSDSDQEDGTQYFIEVNGMQTPGPTLSINADNTPIKLIDAGQYETGDYVRVYIEPDDGRDPGIQKSKAFVLSPYLTNSSDPIETFVDAGTGNSVNYDDTQVREQDTIVTANSVTPGSTGSDTGDFPSNTILVSEEVEEKDNKVEYDKAKASAKITANTKVYKVKSGSNASGDNIEPYTKDVLPPTKKDPDDNQESKAKAQNKEIKEVYAMGATGSRLYFSGEAVEIRLQIPDDTKNPEPYYFDTLSNDWEYIDEYTKSGNVLIIQTDHMGDYSVLGDEPEETTEETTTTESSGGGGG